MQFGFVDDSLRMDTRVYEPRGGKPIGLMLHDTDGRNSLDWLLGGSARAGKPASADYLIERSGVVHKLVPRGMMTYHAGTCRWAGTVDTNGLVSRLLIGIEMECASSAGEVVTDAQTRACAALCKQLAALYNWSPLRAYGHYGLAHPMGRRSDPRGFDWGFWAWLLTFGADTIAISSREVLR